MTNLFSTLLFASACNLDTVLLAAGFRMRGARLSFSGVMIIAAVTTVITFLSLAFGRSAASLLAPGLSRALGGLVLAGMGLWCLLDGLRSPKQEAAFLSIDKNGTAWVILAAALGANNACAGMAAGVSGVDPCLGGAVNFAVTFLSLSLGHWLGRRAEEKGGWPGRCALPASGVLLVALGVLKLRT